MTATSTGYDQCPTHFTWHKEGEPCAQCAACPACAVSDAACSPVPTLVDESYRPSRDWIFEQAQKEKAAAALSEKAPADMVNAPPHYRQGKIEVLDFIEDQKFGYLDGQVIKYVARHRHKGAALEDLRKARFYLDRLIARTEGAA